MQDQFDIQGNRIGVAKDLDTQFGGRLSGLTYKLQKQYKQLKDARGDDYARSHPPARVALNQWTSLIDKWNSKKFKVKCFMYVNCQKLSFFLLMLYFLVCIGVSIV